MTLQLIISTPLSGVSYWRNDPSKRDYEAWCRSMIQPFYPINGRNQPTSGKSCKGRKRRGGGKK